MITNSASTDRLARIQSWARKQLQDSLLPWWYERAVDDARGGVYTCFSNNGRLLSTNKYVWSQGRWAWLMAEIAIASHRGEKLPQSDLAYERALRTCCFLLGHALIAGDRTVYETTADGRPLSQDLPVHGSLHTSVYADVFTEIGLAHTVAAHAEIGCRGCETCQTLLDAARALVVSIEARVSDRTDLTEPYPVPSGYLSYAETMNVVHAASELLRAHDALGQPRPYDVNAIAEKWARILFDQEIDASRRGDLPREFVPLTSMKSTGNPSSLLDTHRTPGHTLEALWFLLRASESIPPIREDIEAHASELAEVAEHACELGWDAEFGGILRYVDRDGGEPRGEANHDRYLELVLDTWSTKLWWPHSEVLYGTAALAYALDSPSLLDWTERIQDYSARVFPSPDGEWIQIRDRQGRPMNRVVALPVKDPFHISRSCLLLTNIMGGDDAANRTS